jgi:hypothetical protein
LVEATRARFRPDKITTLFVGESAPDGGDFFYFGDSRGSRRARSKRSGHFRQILC